MTVKATFLPSRLPGIDVLRAFAASAVVVAHVVKWPWGYAGSAGWMGHLWRFADSGMGNWGVGLFFILSGLCIHLPVARSLAENKPPTLDLKRYLRKRARRIYPPHAVAILLSWLVAAWISLPPAFSAYLSVPTAGQLLAHAFMVHTFVPGAYYSISNVLWTIALEAHFYLLYPFLLRCRRRVEMRTLCAILFGIMVALRLLDHALPISWRGVLTYNFLGRWWEWILGAALAEWLTASPRKQVSPGLVWATAALSALAACAVSRISHGILICAIAGPFVYAFVVALAVRMETRDESVVDGILVAIGLRSYSLYLVHPIALTLVAAALWGRVSSPALEIVASVSASYLAMAIYFSLVEKRFVDIRPAPLRSPSSQLSMPMSPDGL